MKSTFYFQVDAFICYIKKKVCLRVLFCPFLSPVVLSEVIQAFSVPENAARMEEARESACNDMGKMLQLVLPVATQIQQEVIKAYGFNNEGEGQYKAAFSFQTWVKSEV